MRRIGEWVYHGGSEYGAAGWHLAGSPVVIDFMPGCHSCCNGGRRCCRGCYLTYNWPPWRTKRMYFIGATSRPLLTVDRMYADYAPVALYLRDAMQIMEQDWALYRAEMQGTTLPSWDDILLRSLAR